MMADGYNAKRRGERFQNSPSNPTAAEEKKKCFIWSVDQEILTKAKRPLALRPPIANTG